MSRGSQILDDVLINALLEQVKFLLPLLLCVQERSVVILLIQFNINSGSESQSYRCFLPDLTDHRETSKHS